jgi:hypothetical protein
MHECMNVCCMYVCMNVCVYELECMNECTQDVHATTRKKGMHIIIIMHVCVRNHITYGL